MQKQTCLLLKCSSDVHSFVCLIHNPKDCNIDHRIQPVCQTGGTEPSSRPLHRGAVEHCGYRRGAFHSWSCDILLQYLKMTCLYKMLTFEWRLVQNDICFEYDKQFNAKWDVWFLTNRKEDISRNLRKKGIQKCDLSIVLGAKGGQCLGRSSSGQEHETEGGWGPWNVGERLTDLSENLRRVPKKSASGNSILYMILQHAIWGKCLRHMICKHFKWMHVLFFSMVFHKQIKVKHVAIHCWFTF